MKRQEIINRYGPASDDDARPSLLVPQVPGLESIPGLMHDLYQCETADQADAVVQMKACQIRQTGWAGRGVRATAEQRTWAEVTDEMRRRDEAARRVPGTCSGCNSLPCRCLA
jgi:hypothetical protein